MNIKELVLKNRSYRRFDQSHAISIETLKGFIELARISPSAKNAQPLKYILSNEAKKNEQIFECLAWAGYLKEWAGPMEGERPSAYIVMMADHSITDNYFCDHGIAAQSILLGAVEKGLGGCIIASVQRKKLAEILQLPGHLEIVQVISLGKPVEKVVLEEMGKDGNFEYWRDAESVHHVPKRKLDDLIITFF
ncbi:MAG: nitroreductase family protein [Bacteroidales bacterium]